MARTTDALIAELTEALEPVRPLRFGRGLGLALVAAAATVTGVIALFGIRSDLLAGQPDPVFLLSSGLFLLLAMAACVAVIVMSRPQVGNAHHGWIWAASMATLLPLAALLTVWGRADGLAAQGAAARGLECVGAGIASTAVMFAMLVWWLRRGAPTSPEHAGLLAGIAAGSMGMFAFSLHCADNDIVHIGLWHSAVVVIAAAVGRAVVPSLVRW